MRLGSDIDMNRPAPLGIVVAAMAVSRYIEHPLPDDLREAITKIRGQFEHLSEPTARWCQLRLQPN